MSYRMFIVIFLGICSIAPLRANADECSLEQGYSEDAALQVKEAAELAKATLRQIEAFNKLMNSREWEAGKPMGEQMSVAEASEFGRLQKQQQIAMMKHLFESRRDRDLRVIRKMAILADKISRYGLEDSVDRNQESEDFLLASVLVAARSLININLGDLSEKSGMICNLENALKNLARQALVELDKIDGLSSAISESQRLASVYGRPIDISKLSEADRILFAQVVRPKLARGQSLLQRARDLYGLSMIESTSKKMLAALRQDQYESPGDAEYSGTTWNRWKTEGRVSDRDHQLTGVLNFINTKIPATIITDWQEIANRTKK